MHSDRDPPLRRLIAAAGGGGDDGDMELPSRVTALETRLDTVLPTLATKSDVEGLRAEVVTMESRLIKWMVGLVIAGVTVVMSAGFSVFGLVTSRLDAKPAATSVAPVIIQVPAAAQPAAPSR